MSRLEVSWDDDGTLAVKTLCGASLYVQVKDGRPRSMAPLTACCKASGKGADVSTGVVCRSCYQEVDSFYGGVAEWGERTKIGEYFISSTPAQMLAGVCLMHSCLRVSICGDETIKAIEEFCHVPA